jgi:signal transduction histidine kinase
MNLLSALSLSSFLLLGISFIIIYIQQKKIKNSNKSYKDHKRNHDYLVYLLRDLEDIVGFGSGIEYVVDTITKSLENTFPHSTISSGFIKDKKLIFKSNAAETVSQAFVSKIKDSMLNTLGTTEKNKIEIEESITGVAFDDIGASEIKSSGDITLSISFLPVAIINISSTQANLFSEEDKKIFETISYLVSGFLSRIDLLLKYEKSKSLAMIDTFSDGIFMVDLRNDLVAVNDAALKFLNVDSARPALTDLLSSLPNTYNFKEKIEKCMREDHKLEELDVPINGKIFTIDITPVHEITVLNTNQPTHKRDVIGATVLLHDITLEKSLTQMRDDFTNVMVHELRSPLTAIKASSEFLLSSSDLTESEKKRLTQMTSESCRKMLDKISLILDAAKMESGLFVIRKAEADLKKILSDRIAAFTPIAAEKSINFRANIDPSIPIFSFDKTRIDEVVNNLLSNSLKFTPEHGTITLSATLSGDRVIVSVADNGEGIPKDKQDKLFTKYSQAPSVNEHVGTGLGLYVVKQVIENHSGTVSLNSNVGSGTTITFTLPLHPLSTALPKAALPKTDSSQRMLN